MRRPPSPDQLHRLGYPLAADGTMPLPPLPSSPLGTGPRHEQLDRLERMTPNQRVAAMYRGELSYVQLSRWAAAHPEEMAVIDGEFVYIAAGLPDVAEAHDRTVATLVGAVR